MSDTDDEEVRNNVFVHPARDDQNVPLEKRGKKRWGRIAAAGIYFTLFVLPLFLSIIGLDAFKDLVLFIGQNIIPTSPGAESLDKPFWEAIDTFRIVASHLIYLLLVFFVAATNFAQWLRADLKRDLEFAFKAKVELEGTKVSRSMRQGIQRLVEVQNYADRISTSVQKGIDRVDGLRLDLRAIDARITNPDEKRRIVIGVFDDLLIYSPLFVAHSMKYFSEESLEVEFQKIGDDEEVAKGVLSGAFDFGACDPFFAVKCSDGMPVASGASILMPLCKRFGFTVMGTKAGISKVLQRQPVVVGSYEASSTTYLAAFAFKKWLSEEVYGGQGGNDIAIDERKADDAIFATRRALRAQAKSWDFAVFWEPQTSWASAGGEDGFGYVGIPTATNEQEQPLDAFFGESPKGASGYFGSGNDWKLWTPRFASSLEGHRCLMSALLVRKDLADKDPQLIRGVFRAVTRANLHLHSLDWDLDKTANPSIFQSLKTRVRAGPELQVETMERMLGVNEKNLAQSERGGLFPFVTGESNYHPSHYFEQLKACHALWAEVGGFGPQAYSSANDYGRYFIDPKVLRAVHVS